MFSVCMIVKNEIDTLERCINSVYEKIGNIVDDIVVVDTGSTDGTKELAEKLNCKVYDFKWCDDFSSARNYSISKAKNDWIFVVDADEYILNKIDKLEIKDIFNNKFKDYVFFINIKSIDERNIVTNVSQITRIFNKTKYKYKNPIHEQLYRIDGNNPMYKNSNVILEHTGYRETVIHSKNKLENYRNILLKYLEKNPNHAYMSGHLGIVYYNEKNYEKAMEYLGKVIFDDENKTASFFSMMVCTYLKCLIALKQYEVGIIFRELWDYCKDDDEYLHLMGKVYLLLEEYEKALDTFLIHINKKEEVNMDKKYSYYLLGIIFEKFDELDQALICYENCGELGEALQKVEQLKDKLNK